MGISKCSGPERKLKFLSHSLSPWAGLLQERKITWLLFTQMDITNTDEMLYLHFPASKSVSAFC
jgi:hypothetical protein